MTSTTTPTSPHTLSKHWPQLLFTCPRQYRAHMLSICSLGSKYAPPARFFLSGILGPQQSYPPHLMYSLHSHLIISSQHPRTSTTISTSSHVLPALALAFVYMPQAIPSIHTRYPPFRVKICTSCLIISSQHPRTSTTISTSSHILLALAPAFVYMPQAILSIHAWYPPFGVKICTLHPIISSQHPRTSTIISISPHILPVLAPSFVYMPQAIPSICAQCYLLGLKYPTLAHSPDPCPSAVYISYLQCPIYIPHSPICPLAV